ncbi:hypothetical protein MMC30_008351 [Trapelia coarctata]|nr:hypothetical protein [Trapelia coarctata]
MAARNGQNGMARNAPKTPSFIGALGNFELGDERGLLDQIDKLRRSGIEQFVKLPQIVVVGDQSAGKSSVLEALTGIAFPRSGTRCTRFATEIIIRRAKERSFSIDIIPSKERNDMDRNQLSHFRDFVSDVTDFGTLMEIAIELISSKNVRGQFSSKDVLRVEVSGPDQSHLTVVDLPGLIQTSNMHQSKDDVDAIAAIAQRYMKSSRTIILAVVSAANDYANQGVLEKARAVDPKGVRTIGIITKPDKAEPDTVDEFIQLALNKDTGLRLALGWHVLRNRSPDEMGLSKEDIKRTELDFFVRDKWNSLPQSSVGIDALRPRLSLQLQRHIKNNIPDVEREILQALQACRVKLETLGDGRDTIQEMREYIWKQCVKSAELTKEAVDGHYKNPIGMPFFTSGTDDKTIPAKNLRARVVEKNKRFVRDISQGGHSVDFSDDMEIQTRDSAATSSSKGRRKMTKGKYIREVVEPLLRDNAGEELLGDSNPLLVFKLFQKYSTDWPSFAEVHKLEVQKVCNEFLNEIIGFVWPEYMHRGLRAILLDAQIHRRIAGAEAEIKRIFEDRERYLKTYDPEYEERLGKWREQQASDPNYKYSLEEEYLQKMLIYYSLTSKTFINNIIVQVVERHLVHDLGNVFDTMEVSQLTDDQVKRIAQENEQLRHERLTMKEKKRTLEEGLSICRDIDSRTDLEPHSPIEYTPDESDSSDNESPISPRPAPDIPPSSPSTPSRTARRLDKKKATQSRPPIPQASPTSDSFRSAPEPSSTESYSLPGSWATPEPYVSRAPPAPAPVSSQPPTYAAPNNPPLQHRNSQSMSQAPPVPPLPREDSQMRQTPTSPDRSYYQPDQGYGSTTLRGGSEAERKEKWHLFGGRRAG